MHSRFGQRASGRGQILLRRGQGFLTTNPKAYVEDGPVSVPTSSIYPTHPLLQSLTARQWAHGFSARSASASHSPPQEEEVFALTIRNFVAIPLLSRVMVM